MTLLYILGGLLVFFGVVWFAGKFCAFGSECDREIHAMPDAPWNQKGVKP